MQLVDFDSLPCQILYVIITKMGDYFAHFLQKGPRFEVGKTNIRVIDNLALIRTYTVTFEDGTGTSTFAFVYQNINQHWLIIEHHSSVMPE